MPISSSYGALWAYPKAEEVEIVAGMNAADTYVWGDRETGFHRCLTCGCVTHMARVTADPPGIYAVNARMIPTLDPAKVALRQIDNGHTGVFWTRGSEPPVSGRHPKIDAPHPEDWR